MHATNIVEVKLFIHASTSETPERRQSLSPPQHGVHAPVIFVISVSPLNTEEASGVTRRTETNQSSELYR